MAFPENADGGPGLKQKFAKFSQFYTLLQSYAL
jgi:hypothetical protein